MSAKRSPAARVIEFFTTAPVGEADLVYGLVREVIRKRKATTTESVAPVVRRRVRRKVNAKADVGVALAAQIAANTPPGAQ